MHASSLVCRAILPVALIAITLSAATAQHISPIVEPPQRRSITAYEATTRPGPVIILPVGDSTFVGMYSAADGHEILPPRYYNVMGYEPTDTLRDAIIFLMDSARNRYQDAGFTVLPGYEVKCGAFTRGGLLLYEPVWFDNGPDYWAEGRQRFVYDNRMGFVNRFGAVAVPARYPYISPYKGGHAWACRDCQLEVVDSTDTEHGTAWVGTHWTYVDKAGEEGPELLLPRGKYPTDEARWSETLSAEETHLAQSLLKGPVGARFRAVYHLENREAVVRVYDPPSAHSPYYHLALEVDGDGGLMATEFQFLVSRDGKKMLHLATPGMAVRSMAWWWAQQHAANEQ